MPYRPAPPTAASNNITTAIAPRIRVRIVKRRICIIQDIDNFSLLEAGPTTPGWGIGHSGYPRCGLYRQPRAALEQEKRAAGAALVTDQVRSDVEQEVQHVAVLDHVLLAFRTHLAGLFRACFTLVLDEVLEGDGLGADEAPLEIGVDDAGGLGGRVTDADGPGAHFLDPGREVGLQAQQLEAGTDEAVLTPHPQLQPP